MNAKTEWERRKGESRKAFAAFTAYAEMGDSRSLAKTGRALGKSTALMEQWSSRWSWVERAAAYDDHLAELRRVEHEREVIDAAKKHAALARALGALASSELNKVLARSRSQAEALTNRHGEIDIGGLRQLVETFVKLERLVLGEPTEIRHENMTPQSWLELMHAAAKQDDDK